MKRIHLHLGVTDLVKSRAFYEKLFQAKPKKTKKDYLQWILDDPKINFAISTRSSTKGLDHLGIQVNSIQELSKIRENFSKSSLSTHSEGEVTCCYAKSEKSWVTDPNGIAWEAYYTMDDAEMFHSEEEKSESSCC